MYTAVVYELRKSNFNDDIGRAQRASGDERSNEYRWKKSKVAFTMPKAKIATAPMLKYFDPD